MPSENQSLGQQRVRVSFNPDANPQVEQLKKLAADFIDSCELLKDAGGPSEKNRCLSLAQTEIETAAMYAVKGATFPAPATGTAA